MEIRGSITIAGDDITCNHCEHTDTSIDRMQKHKNSDCKWKKQRIFNHRLHLKDCVECGTSKVRKTNIKGLCTECRKKKKLLYGRVGVYTGRWTNRRPPGLPKEAVA